MPRTIGSNLASLNAQRRLAEGTAQLSTTFERLSSGMRINRASDDAAGLSISDSLRADRRVFNQGIRNLNDGISLLSIADAAIESLSHIVVRLKELAEQASNGVYGKAQREAIDIEAQTLSKEYFRIAQSTKFNGMDLFGGKLGEVRLQAGYGLDGGIQSGLGGAIGTGSFTFNGTYQSGVAGNSLQTGDFNGDGITDIAAVSNGSISIMLGNGNGSFQTGITYQTAFASTSMQIGDFNGNGILDLVTVSPGNNTINVSLGNGDGSFQVAKAYAAGGGAHFVQEGDFNGDGILDVASLDYYDARVSVLLGNGDGTFQSRVSYVASGNGYSLQSADLNGNGILDLFMVDADQQAISILFGKGDGTFETPSSFFINYFTTQIQAADVNGDGIIDIVTAESGSVSVLLGNGNGTFQPRLSYQGVAHPNSMQIGDLNGDGHLDIITGHNTSSTANVFLGNGNGTFQTSTSFSIGSSSSIKIADLNSNGVYDLISIGGSNANVFLANIKDGVAPLLPFDLSTMAGARQALPVFDSKIQQLASQRGQIGAFHSRINVAVNTLQSTSENYAAAESRIRDADIASESANLVRLNILQQAAAAVLAQANQQPALAISLLSDMRR